MSIGVNAMHYDVLKPLLEQIRGCTFATIDSETWSTKLIRCVREGERAIIFRTKGDSGYENMVKRRLKEAGKDPDTFNVSSLPWGSRVDDLPLIEHNGNFYLQFVRLSGGSAKYFIGLTNEEVTPDMYVAFGLKDRNNKHQGLSRSDQVVFNTYRIDNIKKIAMLGDTFDQNLVAERPTRSILALSFKEK